MVLPYVFPVVAKSELDRLPRLAEAMGLNVDGMTNQQVLEEITQALTDLTRDLGCLIPLSKFGGKKEDLDLLVKETLEQTRVMGHSSWKLTPEEIREIFEKVL
jgi:alcohol dehydrogenase class IV